MLRDRGDFPSNISTCGVEQWGGTLYKIAVHGAGAKDSIPHMHIYHEQDEYPYSEFDFEISLVDLICEDEIRLTYQLDKQMKLERTIKEECSWQGYEYILNGVRSFLSQTNNNSRYKDFADNLERVIFEWNKETDFIKTSNSGNPLKDYLQSHGLTPHPKYERCLERRSVSHP